MTVLLDISPVKEAVFKAQAQALGLTVEQWLLRLAEQAGPGQAKPLKPKKSAYGLLAKYGPGPSAEEIDQNRAEMFANFPRDDF